jgi:hypothetical protein
VSAPQASGGPANFTSSILGVAVTVGWTGDTEGATGAEVGTTGAEVGTTGAAVGSTGDAVGSTGAAVGSKGAAIGDCVGTTGASVGFVVGATGAGVFNRTCARSNDLTVLPEIEQIPRVVANVGPSGARDPFRIGP